MDKKKTGLLKKVIGVFLIIFGVIGWLFPIIPGWVLFFVGLEFLGINLVFFDRIKAYAKQKIKESKRGQNDKSSN